MASAAGVLPLPRTYDADGMRRRGGCLPLRYIYAPVEGDGLVPVWDATGPAAAGSVAETVGGSSDASSSAESPCSSDLTSSPGPFSPSPAAGRPAAASASALSPPAARSAGSASCCGATAAAAGVPPSCDASLAAPPAPSAESVRAAVAAIGDGWHVMLISSRSKPGRWILPAGGIDPGESEATAAAREAMEEAGIAGNVAPLAIVPCDHNRTRTHIHLMLVRRVEADYLESATRYRLWAPLSAVPGLIAASATQVQVFEHAVVALAARHGDLLAPVLAKHVTMPLPPSEPPLVAAAAAAGGAPVPSAACAVCSPTAPPAAACAVGGHC